MELQYPHHSPKLHIQILRSSIVPPLTTAPSFASSFDPPSTTPPSPSSSTQTILHSSNLDLIILDTYIKTIYVYPATGAKGFFAEDVIERSLARALSHFYPMAGRLIRVSTRDMRIVCNGDGALLVTAKACGSHLSDLPLLPNAHLLSLIPSLDPFSDERSRPLFIAQVTRFECGGVVLGLGVEHHVADGMSAIKFINAWANATRGEPIEGSPCYDRVWLKARSPPKPLFDHEEYSCLPPRPPPKEDLATNGAPVLTTPVARMFDISKEFVHEMKQRCNKDTTLKPFSTYELLAAHVWRCTTRARELKGDKKTMLITLLDGRPRLTEPTLPKEFFGNVIFTCCPSASIKEVCDDLVKTAESVRQGLRRMDGAYCRSAIDWLELQPDLSRFVKGAHTFASPNLGLISWTKLPIYDADFGWGQPAFVGPAFMPWEGHAYLTTTPTIDGTYRLFISLLPNHMEKFSQLIFQLDA